MEEKKLTLNYLVVPGSWIVGGIVALILGLCGLDWFSYLIGLFTGLLNFGLMLKSSRKFAKLAELDPTVASIQARKYSMGGVAVRLLVVAGVFTALFFKNVYGRTDEAGYWTLVIALGGYVTIKIILIAVYLIFGKKVEEA